MEEQQDKKVYGTKAMFVYWIELQGQQNEKNTENAKLNNKRNDIQKKLRDIGSAVIGFGSALTALADEKELLEKELEKSQYVSNYVDMNGLFKVKFGVDYYSLKFKKFQNDQSR